MTNRIYLLDPNSSLIPMDEATYDSESLLQELLARHPDLLAGEQMTGGDPKRWALVMREMGVPDEDAGAGRWSLDHLFLDDDAVPTLVEVKRSTDTRIRREVIGQMLDYAANAVVYWPVEEIRAKFEARCEAHGEDPDEVLAMLLDDDNDGDFWQRVKTNLQAGRIRMVFVADSIPRELRRIVEFLNEQMDPAEVLAVEVRQFVGDGVKTLVPRVVGRTEAAEQRKAGTKSTREKITEADFLAALVRDYGPDEQRPVRRLLDWARPKSDGMSFRLGKRGARCIPRIIAAGALHYPISIELSGTVYFQLRYLRQRPPFDDEANRERLGELIAEIPGLRLTDYGMDGFPAIPVASLADQREEDRLIAALDWVYGQLRGVEP